MYYRFRLRRTPKEAEEKALNRCKNRPATVLYWVYDDGSEIMPSADTYSELIKKVNSWGNGIYYMKIQYDDNQEVDSKYSYELEKIS